MRSPPTMAKTSTKDLTVEQQAKLTSGGGYWVTAAEGGAPSILLSDGPNGLRKQEGAADAFGISQSDPATCFPPAVGLAQTWNPDLAGKIAGAYGEEARAAQVAVVLGPGINIKRSLLGGRNFEFFSEDPLLTAHLATPWVNGVQAKKVGASLKHFAANNQETDRMRISSDVDERTLQEIYLRAFRHVVKNAQPWTVMCSYNRINGVHTFADRWLLTDVLRADWGFQGLVVSDWGAIADRLAAITAGTDLTMPFPGKEDDAELVAAVKTGKVDPEALATSAQRVLDLVEKAGEPDKNATFDKDAHHAIAREAAAQALVLLRNDAPAGGNPLLPLDPAADLLVIGELAKTPRYQGGGSSHVFPTQVDNPLDAITARVSGKVTFEVGYSTEKEDKKAADAAVAAAKKAGTVLLVIGLGDSQESEGFDRKNIDLPADQVDLAKRVLEANPNTVVMTCHGGVVDLTVIEAPALLDAALLGQAVGTAMADVLFGDVDASGRLAETVPLRLQDSPAYTNFPGELSHVTYGEGLFVGYRWYDARDMAVAFPFGHGLSYTTFEYSDLKVSESSGGIEVSLSVTNTGDRDGLDVVQAYVSVNDSAVTRPVRELKGFAKVAVAKGATVPVTITIDRDDLAYWDIRHHQYLVEGGTYTVAVGASSRDLRLTGTVDVTADQAPRLPITLDTSVEEALADPAGAKVFGPLIDKLTAKMGGGDSGKSIGANLTDMLGPTPIGRASKLSDGAISTEQIQQMIDQANAAAK
ncbi:MAG: glycoside hydrolase family 3 C-terminal domain-containing protein [Gordonia sp. (in: high G+C Gram-positive bacteria)]|uniref:glycoside hydrolase family 3 C-terminal domain-containing protein n=1 Tax=Gordonia sp. (in: high G+C Gram-positive bacteria) TaxID=84139 RepID=UPI0039E4D4A3